MECRDAPDVALSDAPEKTLDTLILEMIRANNKVTRDELAKKAGVSKKTIERKLKEMKNVEYIGTGRHGYWQLIESEMQ